MIIVSCVFAFPEKKISFESQVVPKRCVSVHVVWFLSEMEKKLSNYRLLVTTTETWSGRTRKCFPFMNESKLQRWTSESLSFETRRSWQKRRQKEEERILTVTSSISILIINFVSFLFTFPLQLDVLFIEKVNGGFWRSFLYSDLYFDADCRSTHLGWLRMMCHEVWVLRLCVKGWSQLKPSLTTNLKVIFRQWWLENGKLFKK